MLLTIIKKRHIYRNRFYLTWHNFVHSLFENGVFSLIQIEVHDKKNKIHGHHPVVIKFNSLDKYTFENCKLLNINWNGHF